MFKRSFTRLSNNLVIKGTIILTITGLATRFIGFYNRIFLSNLIGARELGIYQLIFPLYMVAFSLTTMGNELALTKLVSEYIKRNEYKSALAFFKTCFVINLLSGSLTALIFFTKADYMSAKLLNAPSCSSCLKIISLGIPFMAMKGAVHGFFLGLERSDVHGISDFLEQTMKVSCIYIISLCFSSTIKLNASFAVCGIVIGEVISFIYSVIMLFIELNKRKADDKTYKANTMAILPEKNISLFFKNALPLTANRFALTLLTSTEAILIPTILLKFYHSSAASLEIYGIFTGMSFPFIMFPATITNSLSIMLLPAVSGASSSLNKTYISRLCEKSISFCLIIGIISGSTFFIYGKLIGNLFFNNKEAGIFLYQLSLLCPLIYLATTIASILNGLGHASHNLLLTVLSTGIRIGFILFAIPRIGITGYIIGLFCGYLFLSLTSMKKLNETVDFKLKFTKNILIPLLLSLSAEILLYILLNLQFANLFPMRLS